MSLFGLRNLECLILIHADANTKATWRPIFWDQASLSILKMRKLMRKLFVLPTDEESIRVPHVT